MQYLKPYTYFYSKVGGTNNLLNGSLMILGSSFVPIIFNMVLFGYQVRVIESLKNDPELEDYPDFNLNLFVEYLTRGIWPAVVQLLVSFVVVGLVFIVYAFGGLIWYVTQEPAIGITCGLILLIPVTLFGTMLSWPMMLHAQLSNGLYFGQAVRFTSSFVRKVGGQMFVALLVHMMISTLLIFVGMLCCFIGVYPAAMVALMAQEHYMVQLYRIYLDEGGEPINGPLELSERDED